MNRRNNPAIRFVISIVIVLAGLIAIRSIPVAEFPDIAIRINDQWRIVFRWTNEGPAQVAIVDYH